MPLKSVGENFRADVCGGGVVASFSWSGRCVTVQRPGFEILFKSLRTNYRLASFDPVFNQAQDLKTLGVTEEQVCSHANCEQCDSGRDRQWFTQQQD